MHTFCHPWVIFAYGGTVWHQDQTSDGFGSIPPRNVAAERHRLDIQIAGELDSGIYQARFLRDHPGKA